MRNLMKQAGWFSLEGAVALLIVVIAVVVLLRAFA